MIAQLAGRDQIRAAHLAEAIQYRRRHTLITKLIVEVAADGRPYTAWTVRTTNRSDVHRLEYSHYAVSLRLRPCLGDASMRAAVCC